MRAPPPTEMPIIAPVERGDFAAAEVVFEVAEPAEVEGVVEE